jgi:hypothetical protein
VVNTEKRPTRLPFFFCPRGDYDARMRFDLAKLGLLLALLPANLWVSVHVVGATLLL